jgi:hypothetical protein
MNVKTRSRKLLLTVESIRTLGAAELRGINGGTVIVTVNDPITFRTGSAGGGGQPNTAYTCTCIG